MAEVFLASEPCQVEGCHVRHDARGHPDPIERFWAQVDVGHSAGCWVWTGHRDEDGYGRPRVGGTRRFAHRFAYEQLRGTILPNLQIDHLCRNRACVNPDHLEVVTGRENTRRRHSLRGSAHGCSRLTDDQVREMYERMHNGETVRAVAESFGVSRATAGHIRTGRKWSHVTEGRS